jgi:hypothetical protein
MLTPGPRSSVAWSVGGNRVGEIMIVPLEDALLLVYRTRSRGEAWQHQKQVVPFITTATAFGGCRRWFACPQCDRLFASNALHHALRLSYSPPFWCVEHRPWPYHGDVRQTWLAARKQRRPQCAGGSDAPSQTFRTLSC